MVVLNVDIESFWLKMITILKPSNKKMENWIHNKWQNSTFSYPEVGDTQKEEMPSGYNHDINKIKLGQGEKVFLKGKEAIEKWKMYGMNWISVYSDSVPIEKDQIAITYLGIGLWGTNPCRIIYVIDESNDAFKRFGFAFGTIADHPEVGEEQFLIEWNRENDSIVYQIKAFSRPRHILAQMGYPVVRYLQKRFFRDSLTTIASYVQETTNV